MRNTSRAIEYEVKGKLLHKSNEITSQKITLKKLWDYRSRYFSEKVISNLSLQITLNETFNQTNSGLRQLF